MPKNNPQTFACTQCGACCRRIAHIRELAEFDNGAGICKYLDSNNRCAIYANRPRICRIEAMFEVFANSYSKAEFYALNAKACNILQELESLPTAFRVRI